MKRILLPMMIMGAFTGTLCATDETVNGSVSAYNFKGSINGAVNVKDTCSGTCTAAVGDGVTDDTAAINQHIAYAAGLGNKPIFAPVGTYKITSTLLFQRTNGLVCLGLRGEGPGTVFATDQNIAMITIDAVGGRLDGLRFSDFRLVNTGTGPNDIGILFSDSGTPAHATNYVNNFMVSNIDFNGLSYGIRNTRAATDGGGEGGLNWCIFTNLTFWNPGVKTPLYNIKFDKGGGGTGNVFNNMTGLASEAFISMGDGTQNTGDLLFSNLHIAGASDHAVGLKLLAGPYGSNVAISSCQADAGIVTALDLTGLNNFTVTGNNWGGGVILKFTTCDHFYLQKSSYATTNFNSCSNYTIADMGTLELASSLSVRSLKVGEALSVPPTNATLIGTVSKNTAPSGEQGVLKMTSSDASNRLEGVLGLSTGPLATDKYAYLMAIEQNVAWRPIVLGGGAGVVIGTGSTDPGEGAVSLAEVRFRPRATPSSPTEGDCYQDSSDHHFYIYNGTAWKQLDN